MMVVQSDLESAQFKGLHSWVLNKISDYGGSNETKEEEEDLSDEEDDKMQPVSAIKRFTQHICQL